MLIPEAVQLVLHAAAQADNGATYVLEMGEQVKLVDLARHLIQLSGLVPEDDIAIEFIGLRPGEKLCEELVGEGEMVRPSAVDKILRVIGRGQPSTATLSGIRAIEERASEGDAGAVTMLLARLLPTYERAEPILDPLLDPVSIADAPAAAAIGSPARAERVCHRCRSGFLHRSRARTIFERVVRAVGDKRLFVCDECGWRGWLMPIDVGVAASADALKSLDLRDIDAAIAITPFLPDRSSSPHSLN